jgi:hypothetical protein
MVGGLRAVRCAHFRVLGRFDGAQAATVTVEYHGPGRAFIRVRPLRRRRAYELDLADVARGVVFDVVKHELAEKRKARKERR